MDRRAPEQSTPSESSSAVSFQSSVGGHVKQLKKITPGWFQYCLGIEILGVTCTDQQPPAQKREEFQDDQYTDINLPQRSSLEIFSRKKAEYENEKTSLQHKSKLKKSSATRIVYLGIFGAIQKYFRKIAGAEYKLIA